MASPQQPSRLPCVVIILVLIFVLATCVVAFDNNRFPVENIDPRLLVVSAVVRNATTASYGDQEGVLPTAATMAVDTFSHHMFTSNARPPGPPDSPAPSLVGGRSSPPHRQRMQRSQISSYLDHTPTPGVVNRSPIVSPSQHLARASPARVPSPSIDTTPSVSMMDVEIHSHPPISPEGASSTIQWLTRQQLPRDGKIPGGARCPHPKCAGKDKVFDTWRPYHKHKKEHRQRYQCRMRCNEMFGHRARLISHERSCGNTREYACPTCGRCFNRQDILDRHETNVCLRYRVELQQ